jgi:hypothetical protein
LLLTNAYRIYHEDSGNTVVHFGGWASWRGNRVAILIDLATLFSDSRCGVKGFWIRLLVWGVVLAWRQVPVGSYWNLYWSGNTVVPDSPFLLVAD